MHGIVYVFSATIRYMTGKKVSFNFTIPSFLSKITMTHILVTLLILSSFTLGSLWTRVQYLESGGILGNTTTAQADTTPPVAEPAEDLSPKEVSIDDDPVLGDKDAPVTIVEFSDYECPFCKRFFDESLVEIKKEYIDTGKVKMVYRDMPLSFHDPMATTEAVAANCARAQGGDTSYFAYHDEIYKRTTSNGNGLDKEKLLTIATNLALDTAAFTTCLESDTYKEEIAKDMSDATAVGASATPSFFIGKSTATGVIVGTPLIGAYPFADFKKIIDEKLAE